MNLLIAVPAYNEEDTIAKVIEDIMKKTPDYDFIVICDGSNDSTSQICNELGCALLDLPVNLGLSGAFGCAMKYAWERGYDAIVQIDADGQHDPANIEKLVKVMENTNSDIVVGSRYCENHAPFNTLRGIGSHLVTALIKLRTGTKIYDPTSGMRLYNRRVIKQFVNNDYMEPEPHILAYLLKRGYKISETYVKMYERESGASYLKGLKVIRYMSHVCLSILIV